MPYSYIFFKKAPHFFDNQTYHRKIALTLCTATEKLGLKWRLNISL